MYSANIPNFLTSPLSAICVHETNFGQKWLPEVWGGFQEDCLKGTDSARKFVLFDILPILYPDTRDAAETAGTPTATLDHEVTWRWTPWRKKIEGVWLPGHSIKPPYQPYHSYLWSSFTWEDKTFKINDGLMVSVIKSQAKFLAFELGRFMFHYTSAYTLKQISDQHCLLQGADSIFPQYSLYLHLFFFFVLELLVSPPNFDNCFRPLHLDNHLGWIADF